MKKNDIAILILIASISLVAAYFIGKAVLGDPSQNAVKVDTIEAINTKIEPPDERIFNSSAINPTIETNIGNSSNQQPFTGN